MAAPTDPFELLKLERGWDSYYGLPPDQKTVEFAAKVGSHLGMFFPEFPQYVPCSGGEVQIEWHCDQWDVEVYIKRFNPEVEQSPSIFNAEVESD